MNRTTTNEVKELVQAVATPAATVRASEHQKPTRRPNLKENEENGVDFFTIGEEMRKNGGGGGHAPGKMLKLEQERALSIGDLRSYPPPLFLEMNTCECSKSGLYPYILGAAQTPE